MQLRIRDQISFVCLALPLSCMAGTMGPKESSKLWSIPLQVGFFGASQGASQHINIESLIGNQYTVEDKSEIAGLAGIGLYYNGYSQEHFLLSYGINLFYLGKTTVRGDIAEENLFTNLSYRYDIQNLPVYAAAKALIYTTSPKINISVDAGIGPNFMWTSNYNEIPRVDFAVPNMTFKGTSATIFSATAGVGIQLNNIFGSMPVECGYRFFYLGKGDLSKASDQPLNTLNTGDTYANALVCSVIV